MKIEIIPNIHKLDKTYLSPKIKKIQIDNEISLALESVAPPEGPNEISENNNINNNPYHTGIG
jgi:hypothetical protein